MQSRQSKGVLLQGYRDPPGIQGQEARQGLTENGHHRAAYLLSFTSLIGSRTVTLSSSVTFLLSRGRPSASANCTSKYRHTVKYWGLGP